MIGTEEIWLLNQKVTMIIPIKADDFKYLERLIPLLKKNIAPKEIIIISTQDIEKMCHKIGVNFINEGKLVKNLNFKVLKNKLEELQINSQTTGWYFQQFIKFGFALICKTPYYISWDADMLPIRPINLFDNDSKPYFTLKKEYLRRYFITLKKLLNIEKTRNESFIAEHMLFNTSLVRQLIGEIEHTSLNGNNFWEKILYASIPEAYKDPYAFSEFETYGNWVDIKYPDTYATRKLQMFRHAKYYFGENPDNKDLIWAAKNFDTLSFEHFDTQIVPTCLRKIAQTFMSLPVFLHLTYPLLKSSFRQALKDFDWFWGNTCGYDKAPANTKNITDFNRIKILFDASFLNEYTEKAHSRTGIYWVTWNILKQLNKRSELKIYLHSNNLHKTKKFLKYHQQEFPNVHTYTDDILNIDIYLSPFNIIPQNIKQTNIPCFTIIHDCIPMVLPEYFEVCKEWFPDLLHSFNKNDYAFANSECTKQDFLKFCPALDKDKITVIPLSTNIEYKPNKNKIQLASAKQKYHIPQNMKYIFSLCSLEPRKNLIRAVRTFIKFIEKNKIDDMVFVLGGSAWNGFIEKFEKEVPEYAKYKNKIIRAGYIDDEDLEILYSNAEWFVYTSQYEGFGMPPLEAMACGCPVITSNNSSLPEVIGNAGIMIDWDSDEQHIESYEKYYFDVKYRQTMAEKGLKQASKFSWQKAADIMVETFQKTPQVKNRTSFILQKLSNNNEEKTISVKLFNFIQLFKIYSSPHKKKYKLCGFIPLYSRKQFGGRKIFEFFGIPFFKIRKMSNGITTKYYFLNLPILKISRK